MQERTVPRLRADDVVWPETAPWRRMYVAAPLGTLGDAVVLLEYRTVEPSGVHEWRRIDTHGRRQRIKNIRRLRRGDTLALARWLFTVVGVHTSGGQTCAVVVRTQELTPDDYHVFDTWAR